MIPRRQIKITPRTNKLDSEKAPNIQPQVGGLSQTTPNITEIVKKFVADNPRIRNSLKTSLLEISNELKGVDDIIEAYRIIDIYVTQQTDIFITNQLKNLISYMANKI